MGCPIVLSGEFLAVEDDNVFKAPIMADKDILKFVQSSKNIMDADSNDGNNINNATPVSTIFEKRSIMKSTRSYLDAHFNREYKTKWTISSNLMLKKTMQ
ncbi:hypothetical protein TNCV_3821941 [Trichonephila clavipes]|nr:hypothetical protein TNCV_3821941 [Trichonephila clavipes]